MNAIIYTRVSTAVQADKGISLVAQLSKARDWCRATDHAIIGEFSDAGISGKRTDNRPGLQEAIDDACEHKAALVVYSLSRLARSTKDMITLSERLGAAGADLVSLSESIDTTTATGKMIFRLLAVLSEFDRDLASERTTAALAHKKANGFKTGGTVPYGYNVGAGGKLSPNAKEHDEIINMIRLRVAGCSLHWIAGMLNQTGIPTKTGKRWRAQTIKRILVRVGAEESPVNLTRSQTTTGKENKKEEL